MPRPAESGPNETLQTPTCPAARTARPARGTTHVSTGPGMAGGKSGGKSGGGGGRGAHLYRADAKGGWRGDHGARSPVSRRTGAPRRASMESGAAWAWPAVLYAVAPLACRRRIMPCYRIQPPYCPPRCRMQRQYGVCRRVRHGRIRGVAQRHALQCTRGDTCETTLHTRPARQDARRGGSRVSGGGFGVPCATVAGTRCTPGGRKSSWSLVCGRTLSSPASRRRSASPPILSRPRRGRPGSF